MSLPKYILALVGGGSMLLTMGKSTPLVVLGGIGFGIFCFIIGFVWYKSGAMDSEIEINNKVNPFIREMRNSKLFK